MCCCCGCCGKILKIVCSIIWIVVVLAIIACIIVFAIAWGGSEVMQDVIKTLVNSDSELGTFGNYISSISTGNPAPSCIDFNVEGAEEEIQFGWKIDFDVVDKGLGVYARMSNKGIDDNKAYIMHLIGNFDGSEKEVYIYIPKNEYDQEGNHITDPKKQYIIHDRYMRLDAYGNCPGPCPSPDGEGKFNIKVFEASVHLRLSFKSVPDFINIPFDIDSFDYDEFVDVIYKIVKVFDKESAKTVRDSMQTLSARVTNFGMYDQHCPLSANYQPDAE